MRTVNKVILIGNVTKDPLVKTTEGGKKVALFTIATNRYFKTSEWENKSESEFHSCTAWWNLAERVESFLTKGKLVYIEGRLRTRVLEAREDSPRSFRTEVVISNLIFLNKRSDFSETIEEETLDDIPEEEDRF